MKITDLNLLELDTSNLEATKFYSAYSGLPFNRGLIFRQIGTHPQSDLADIINGLNREVYEVTIQNTSDVTRIKANMQIHDFIFDLLTHKDIDKKWRYNDGASFTELSEKFNSQQSFRKIGLFEIAKEDFTNRLEGWSMMGSCYGRMPDYGEEERRQMINSFIDSLLSDPDDRIIVSTQPWGQYLTGWFECFFLIKKATVLILGHDDYD